MRAELVLSSCSGEVERFVVPKTAPVLLVQGASGELQPVLEAGPGDGAAVRLHWDASRCVFVVESLRNMPVFVGEAQVSADRPYAVNRGCAIRAHGRTAVLDIFFDSPRCDGRETEAIELNPKGRWEFGRGDRDASEPGSTRVALDDEAKRISSVHAVLEADGELYRLRDESRYGTYLNGERFKAQELVYGDRFRIGEYVFEFLVHEIRRVDGEAGGEISARWLGKHVPVKNPETGKREMKAILANVDLDIAGGEFVGILGGSGQGKSTLMNCLCGIALPTEGEAIVNGVKISGRAALRSAGIGFVPQEDIVHRELTVRQALSFSARLKLKLPRAAARGLVDSVMAKLGLSEHRDKLVGKLSGGQRKRVSIAAELLARPRVLFLDEPSSGLDPATEFELMSLLQSLAATGMTVVCTTHVLENAHLFDRLLWVQGGRMVFFGNHRQAREYFLSSGTESILESDPGPGNSSLGLPRLASLVRIYKMLSDSRESPLALEEQFRASRYFQPPAERATLHGPAPKDSPRPGVGFWNTLRHLAARQGRILGSDPWNLVFLLAQALVIALLISWVADGPVLRGFLAIVATLWFGCSNGAQQIVGEMPVFQRERISGQGRNAYMASKIGFLSAVTLLQASLLVLAMLWSARLFHPDKGLAGRQERIDEVLRSKLFPFTQRTLSSEEEDVFLLGAFDGTGEARVTREGLLESASLPGVYFMAPGPDSWKPGGIVETLAGETLRLPNSLPPYRAGPFAARSVRPGLAESPFAPGAWKRFSPLERDLWRPAAAVRCPLTGQDFILPRRLPPWPENTLRFRLARALVKLADLEEVVLASRQSQVTDEMRRLGIEAIGEMDLGKALAWPLGLLAAGFFAAGVTGVCLGLAISALVGSPTQAVMWVPLVLIPQILFGGFVVTYPEMESAARAVSRLVPSFACQRVLDVSHVFGRLTPRTANQSKMPVFLSGEREIVEWTPPGGRRKREYYDRADERNVSWQNLLVLPEQVGHREVEKTSELIYDQRGALKRSHEIVPDSVAYRRDLRYGYVQGIRYVYIGEAQRSALVLLGWFAVCFGFIHLGLHRKERLG